MRLILCARRAIIQMGRILCIVSRNPVAVLAISVVSAVVFVLLMLPLPRFPADRRWYLFFYHAPIGMVFVSYLLDRIAQRSQIRHWQWIIELLVVSVGLIRALFLIPFVSGHALLLSYILVTSHFRLVWWLALVVFVDVVYVKVFVLADPTLIGGVIGGVLAGTLVLNFPESSELSGK